MWFLLFDRVNSTNNKKKQAGFTLIEILLVIVLLGIVSIAAINAFDGNEDQARENITRLEMAELQKALLQFRRDNRELPCSIYRPGVYNPLDFRNNFGDVGFIDAFVLPAGGASQAVWQDWCLSALNNASNEVQASNALFMLNTFPYDIADPDLAALTWNRSTQLGWNGPYISKEGLTDGWGNPYLLLEAELTLGQNHRCEADSGDYAIDSSTGNYVCVAANDAAFDPVTDILPADIARIVSSGPDGILDSEISNYDVAKTNPDPEVIDDPCIPQNDDFVLCLLR
ncbi:type II secretion system protein GspG [Methylophaga sp. OBS1]|uniref:type II secretion system protein GspG n=1 Tax=Methylophaga sp. OBS1 TaxID=2991933 RepID=UPI002257E499|nr:type II secretion system protein GspG [Methylophaga sp. OBS1]MCX4190957.1 type II secretion system protein GspG [Methylophaga sp. OBS1]MCX4192097.1 type II secretion system protein GspG [Methylophaga sp. OBS1]